MYRLLIAVTIITVSIAASTLAQQAPPARVGRVSFVSGNLAFHTAGQTEWSAAAVNHPVATGGAKLQAVSAPDASASGAVSLPSTMVSSVLRVVVIDAAAASDHSPMR